jgi:hypothetical protein
LFDSRIAFNISSALLSASALVYSTFSLSNAAFSSSAAYIFPVVDNSLAVAIISSAAAISSSAAYIFPVVDNSLAVAIISSAAASSSFLYLCF